VPTHPPPASELSSEQSLALIKIESCRHANEAGIVIAKRANFGVMSVGSIARRLIAHVFVLAELF
jgi:ribosomal protein L35AE/L33A